MLELGAHYGVTFAGLVVLKPDNGPELPVQVQDHAVLEIVRRRHAWPPFSTQLLAHRGQRPSLDPRSDRYGLVRGAQQVLLWCGENLRTGQPVQDHKPQRRT